MTKGKFHREIRPLFFAFALSLCGAMATVLGIMQPAEGAEFEPLLNSDTAAARPSASAVEITLNFFSGVAPDYDSSALCGQLGGILQSAPGGRQVCSQIDANDTFCIVGEADAFPCQGLYKHALICNQYNRPALNPFFCGARCPSGEFACGAGCARGSAAPVGRIPYVAGDYIGKAFTVGVAATVSSSWGTTALAPGHSDFALARRSSFLTVSDIGAAATVSVHLPLSPGSEHSGTVVAHVSCGGLEAPFRSVEVGFTVTALAAQPLLTARYESAPWTWGAVTATIAGVGGLAWVEATLGGFTISREGAILPPVPRPSDGAATLLTLFAVSPDILGSAQKRVRAEFYHPFNGALGANHCRNPQAGDYAAARVAAGCGAGATLCRPDSTLTAALRERNPSDLCRALRESANAGLDFRSDAPLAFVGGWTLYADYPLAMAVRGNWEAAARTLTVNGAFNLFKNFNLLNHAALGGAEEILNWLAGDAGLDVNDDSGGLVRMTPVHMLALRMAGAPGDGKAFAQWLVDERVNPNEPVFDSRPFDNRLNNLVYLDLVVAPRTRGQPDHLPLEVFMKNELLDPARPFGGKEEEPLPLALAVRHGYTLVVSVLLTNGVDVNQRHPGNQETALFYVNSPGMADLLLAYEASVGVSVVLDDGSLESPLDSVVDDWDYAEGAAEKSRLSLTAEKLWNAGARCLWASGLGQGAKALCEGSAQGSSSPPLGVSLGEAVCGAPEVVRVRRGRSLYVSRCEVSCPLSGGGSESIGEWRCLSRASDIQAACASRAPRDSGLWCAADD